MKTGRVGGKLLIFVIAYYAEKTLRRVLERIPAEIFERYDCEVLVVDDASEDQTFEIGRAYKAERPDVRMTVLRNELNQGYGGNQKVGYAYALAGGFDYVAMIHGDGQYAPEELPRLMGPFERGEADAVFGSRMLTPLGAIRGGMPFYKYVGNKALSLFQNVLLGSGLSEFHSGYRVYSTAALRAIPFLLNSNDFHFDTEIIIQLLNAKKRIVELPIPTYYGDEVCRVDGLRYAKDVARVTLQNVAHRAGVLYQRRFDPAAGGNAHYDLKLGYPSSHTFALDAVPPGARVLDIGAGPAGLAKELAAKGCRVTVVDQFEPPEPPRDVEVVVQDLDGPVQFDVKPHSHLLLLDVIEHLSDPEAFLEDLRSHFDYDTKTVVLTTPNVAFIIQRLMLLAGQFNYGKAGILDRTHTRLFTFRSLQRLLRDSGFRIKEVRGVPAPFPKVLGEGPLGRAAVEANLWLIRLSKSLFSYQIFVVAETTPDINFILRNTRNASELRSSRPPPPRANANGAGHLSKGAA
ncbi:MAG TPA: bifunctional glycosyltransferase/class I SAM-dependent methyltransferase [Polyangiaceae bacterium]|nr:bifunctional glycosyltransferase/class I SAM-dependent methyltransferase [Polyangiaceae bacterium]